MSSSAIKLYNETHGTRVVSCNNSFVKLLTSSVLQTWWIIKQLFVSSALQVEHYESFCHQTLLSYLCKNDQLFVCYLLPVIHNLYVCSALQITLRCKVLRAIKTYKQIPNSIWANKSIYYFIIFFFFLFIKMGVQMYVSLPVGMWKANGNPNPCTDLDEILHPHPHLPKEGFGEGLTPSPSPLGPGAWNSDRHIFENCLQNKRY